MFKCHLDVGFTDTQAGVTKKYFEVYYPLAMKRAAQMREPGADRYTWTTGSWLLYEYLEQASSRRAQDDGAGDRGGRYRMARCCRSAGRPSLSTGP